MELGPLVGTKKITRLIGNSDALLDNDTHRRLHEAFEKISDFWGRLDLPSLINLGLPTGDEMLHSAQLRVDLAFAVARAVERPKHADATCVLLTGNPQILIHQIKLRRGTVTINIVHRKSGVASSVGIEPRCKKLVKCVLREGEVAVQIRRHRHKGEGYNGVFMSLSEPF